MADAPSGFLVINKPKNWTSFDVVAKVRALTGVHDIGHAGTLDPFATGVLVLAINRARFLVDRVQAFEKVYRGRVRLGQTSDSDDVDGSKTTVEVMSAPNDEDVRLALAQFTGDIKQVPPKYSALKVQGRRMYAMARKGQAFERPARNVTIHELKLLGYDYPTIDIEARVGSGTYIRALARDIGEALKTGGFLETLVRHRIGPFTLEDAYDVHTINGEHLSEMLEPLEIAIEDLPRLIVGEHDLRRLTHGETIRVPSNFPKTKSLDNVAVVNEKGVLQLMARYDKESDQIKSRKLFDAKQEH
jgi:tRNA pseudouridine55 synthase